MDTIDSNSFGSLLKRFRIRRKFTQETLAYEIDKSRGSIQAWENGPNTPNDRKTVLEIARALQLSKDETDALLLAAHHSQEYHTQGISSSTLGTRGHLYALDIYIDERGYSPVVDITLHNSGTQIVLPFRVQIEILDVGEFYYFDEENDEEDSTRSFLEASGHYDVKLSPAQKGKTVPIKIAHKLQAGETDRFQLSIRQDFINSSCAYVWYYLQITIFYNEAERAIKVNPLLLSFPPVGADAVEHVWLVTDTPRAERNRATLQRMAGLRAIRSASVETTIRQVGGTKNKG